MIISSKMTFFHKKVLPFLIFAFLAVFFCLPFVIPDKSGQPHPPPPAFFLFPIIFGLIIFTALRKFVFDLADEVTDSGDFLMVRFGAEQDQIFLSNIVNISYAFSNPPRALVYLRQPCKFGKEIAFCPKSPLTGPFRFLRMRNAIIDELIWRIDAKRKT